MSYKKRYKELIAAYEADVQFPDVSGMEHLDMLMTRSEISRNELHLSDEERERVENADKVLLQNAEQFYDSIRAIADLASWRSDENVPPTHWWWYLDVIVKLPMPVKMPHKSSRHSADLSSTHA